MKRLALLPCFALLAPAAAVAQTPAGFSEGLPVYAPQWNSLFGGKLDQSGGISANLNGALSGVPGASFTGTDVTAALQAEINAVAANPQGGIIQVPCGVGAISATVTVSASNVHLRGCGVGNDWTGSTTVGGGTELRWTGASGGTMVQYAPPSGAATPLYDSDAYGIILNGQNVAGTAWNLASVRNGVWNIGFAHVATVGVTIGTAANVSGSPAFQGNDMSIIGDVRDTGAGGVVLNDAGTPGTANVSLNLFRRILVMDNTGVGLTLTDTDNNGFDWVDILSIASSGAQAVQFNSPHGAGSDRFYYLNTNGGAITVGTGYVGAWFYELNHGNGTPYPVLQGTATAFWQTDSVQRSVVPNMAANCGPGAVTADIADGTNAGCRGPGAVDFQQQRAATAQVASGTGAVLLGYSNNTASAQGCDVLGYTWNVCNGTQAQTYGSYGNSEGRLGAFTWEQAQASRSGDAQAGLGVAVASSADTSTHRLTADNSGANTNANCFNLPSYATYALTITLVAQDVTTPGNRQMTTYPAALLMQDNGPSSTTLLLGTPVSLSQGTTGTFGTPAADTGNGCLVLTWTAPNTDTWKAVARITSAETGR